MAAIPIHDPTAPPIPGARTEVKNTTCYMCACRCGIRVHLREGEVRYIDGNPEHPLNQGVICAKGSSGIMKQYSPARLTQPLLRKPSRTAGPSALDDLSGVVFLTLRVQALLATAQAASPASTPPP